MASGPNWPGIDKSGGIVYLEYEDAAKRAIGRMRLAVEDVDDMLLELAVVANCDFIVTYNKRDFQGAEQFGVRAVTPKEFLRGIGELP